MKIKRIKTIKINSYNFKVIWDKNIIGGGFSYRKMTITIGTKVDTAQIFEIICHELFEIIAVEMSICFDRPDCTDDFIFVYDHRQHDTMMSMFAGLLEEFIV